MKVTRYKMSDELIEQLSKHIKNKKEDIIRRFEVCLENLKSEHNGYRMYDFIRDIEVLINETKTKEAERI